ncbi:MAG: acyl carrier protein [Herminiimonas sp.]|nr:acyl carrier protein [Herminiimonas sp.]
MTEDQQNVLAILSRCAGCESNEVNTDDTFADLDIDSLKFIMLILEIEETLERSVFNIETVGELRTVGDLMTILEEA